MVHLVDTDDEGLWRCGCEDSFYNGHFCGHLKLVRKHMSKTKYPRALALKVAAELCRELKPVCARLIVAGSLRRRKELVGDVEILFVPMFKEVADGLFDTKQENQAERVIESWLKRGVLMQRVGVAGATSWGAKNKLAVHAASKVPVDLFTATEANWFNYLTCRTGGAESNVEVASAAQAKGWKWNPYGEGFTDQHGRIVPVTSEADVFRLVGLNWKEAWERR
jgi:DNA polymerase/3'-5' exonuclease PolX